MKKLIKVLMILTLTVALPASAATLSVSPSSKSITAGETFTLNILLDTQGVAVDGVDVYYLNTNPSLLEVVDQNSAVAGVQITPGNLFGQTVYNQSNNTTGQIAISQVANGGTTYTGSGILATVTFLAKVAGSANLTFNHTAGNTADSNVAANGTDVLSAVVNGAYTINGAAGSSSGGGGGGGGGSVTYGGGSSSGGGSAFSPSAGSGVLNNTLGASGCAPGLSIAQINSVVGRGSSGENVTNLQKFLVERGYLQATDSLTGLGASNVTGYFGPATEAALKKFQATEGIVSSGDPLSTGYGNAGPSTRAKINSLIATSIPKTCSIAAPTPLGIQIATTILLARNIGRGSEGQDVKTLQQFLVARGYTTADNVTGYFGPITEVAVKAFQRAEGIVNSGDPISTGYGNVGPSTRARINAQNQQSQSMPAVPSASAQSMQQQLEALQKQVLELLIKLQSAQ